ncbi:MAG: methyltransferase [Taibaiella sp.]|nr:methyltransferase [Taibaiella sp.]
MRKLIKYLAGKTIQPIVARYLSQTRVYTYNSIKLTIPPDVFHPAFFFSTHLLLRYISGIPLSQKKLLELGAGNGLIAMSTARMGAIVTATDINKNAIKYLADNAAKNQLPLTIIYSNLFDHIPVQQFDIIAINPPYYKKDPHTDAAYAWYCGGNGEYFVKLFQQLGSYIGPHSQVLMILSEDCDIGMIASLADRASYSMSLIRSYRRLWERLYLYTITSAPAV